MASRENTITKLQIGAYLLNLAAVCLVAGTMNRSILEIVRSMKASAFLNRLQARPWNPGMLLAAAVGCYLCLVCFSCLGQLWEDKSRWARWAMMGAEILFCVGATIAMNMNYDGLVLLVVADMIRGQKGSRQKLILGAGVIALYALVDYNLMGGYLGMVPWESFLGAFGPRIQALLRGIKSVCVSVNLVLFILYMAMLIQGEYRERERIQTLNLQLEEANRKLKLYAAEAERNAETRERNRLAREIHDTLGHALTGIVAGIDACLTILDLSPEAARTQLEKIGEVARQGIRDVRRSVSKLRPDALEKLELEEAILKMLEDLTDTAGVKVSFQNEVTPFHFHEDEEDVIYRVLQEASTNAVRHGHADQIWIQIRKKEQWLTIEVKDNGIGCGQVKKGFGLKHMEERLALLGGSLEYESREGFFICARIPIRWGEEF